MRFLSVQEFSKSPQAALSNLSENEDEMVLTSRGKPAAVVIYADESTLKDTLLDIKRMRAKRDLLDIRTQAMENGTSLTLKEINAEIKLARQERNAKSGS